MIIVPEGRLDLLGHRMQADAIGRHPKPL